IAFYTGILEKLELTDDENAAVMGHEISHALRGHGRERARPALGPGRRGGGRRGPHLAGGVRQVPYLLPYSRIHETEADRMGVELAARAGYDPRAAIVLWQKMAKVSGGGGPPGVLW